MADRGDGYAYQRPESSRWWISYSVRGVRHRESGGRTEEQAAKKLKARLREAAREDFAGPKAERVTVDQLLDGLLVYLENNRRRSVEKVRSHLKNIRAFFSGRRAVAVTSADVESYKRARLEAGRAEATVDRELECLHRAYRYAARQTPPLYPPSRIPSMSYFRPENKRQGFFDPAEVEALLQHVPDPDIREFIEWGFRTGMRKGEIARLTWDMLDRSGEPWVLRAPGSITKNGRGRSLGLAGETRAIIERRLKVRRFDSTLIFHRTSKGKAGEPVKDFRLMWSAALKAAGLPAGRIFHDLRRSAVRNLIRAGVDPSVAMKVSGHRTRSMLDRYNVIEEAETAAALAQTDAFLSMQPKARNVEVAQFRHSGETVSSQVSPLQQQLAEAGRNRTYRCRR